MERIEKDIIPLLGKPCCGFVWTDASVPTWQQNNALGFCWNETQSIRFSQAFNRHLNTNVQKINLIVAGQAQNRTLHISCGIFTSELWHGQIYLTCCHLFVPSREYRNRVQPTRLSAVDLIRLRVIVAVASPWLKREISQSVSLDDAIELYHISV
jgi:hypothetical protein